MWQNEGYCSSYPKEKGKRGEKNRSQLFSILGTHKEKISKELTEQMQETLNKTSTGFSRSLNILCSKAQEVQSNPHYYDRAVFHMSRN